MDTVVVLTSKGLETMFEEGGTGHWVAAENSVASCKYVVAVANSTSGWSSHEEEIHHHAFLIGKLSGVKKVPGEKRRLIFTFNEYAEIDVPEAWQGQRNPVRYTSLSEFDIDPDSLSWKEFPKSLEKPIQSCGPLTIDEAKQGLAQHFGIPVDCIEIVIRA